MTLIFCVDNNFGLMFNKRRQSRDSVVIEDIINNYGKIYISPYSERLFTEIGANYELCEDFMNCEENCVCFVEDKYSPDLLKKAEQIILYNWNRLYPADVHLDYQIILDNFKLTENLIFKGSSHNEIERERYIR